LPSGATAASGLFGSLKAIRVPSGGLNTKRAFSRLFAGRVYHPIAAMIARAAAKIPAAPLSAAPVPDTPQHAAAKPAKKPIARTTSPKPAAPVAYNDYGTPPPPPPMAQAPATPVETPKPVAQPGNLATVQAVREVKDAGESTALGPVAGGIAGAVLGNQIGKGHGSQKVITVLGAAGGAFAGHAIEKQARGTTHWEVDVRRDDGTNETVRSDVAPSYQPGQRVRLIDGKLQPA